MLNIEKYEEEIKKEIANFRDIPCIVKDLKDGGCGENRNCVTCSMEMLHWLSQEYKEPILTDEEKEFIKTIISSFKERWLISIEWFETTITSRICIFAREKEGHDLIVESIEIPMLLLKESMFQGLEKNREYTLEELEL